MSNDNDTQDDTLPQVSELDALKARADQLKISYHPSIGLEKLREKVNERMNEAEEKAPAVVTEQVTATEESLSERRYRKRREANELVRIRVSCMNPAKKDYEGEYFTAGNSLVGSFTKYVPFNNDEGWHVPRIILQQIQQRMCQIFVNSRDDRGRVTRVGKQIKEFAVEIMPNLTPAELQALAQRQAMANGTQST